MTHPTAWLLWWLAALVAALVTQNPLYMATILLVTIWVGMHAGGEGEAIGRPGLRLVVRLGLPIVVFTALFNMLTIHVGATVLFRVASRVPVVGGPITLEALSFGLITGLNLVTLIAVFSVFNLAADYRALLRMLPGFVFQAGLVTSIALAFVPQTLAALQEIREAQMIRGHRFRGWRDVLPLFLPLLTSGLERSIQLAEAMESRGFGGPRLHSERRSLRPQLAVLGGLFATLPGLGLAMLGGERAIGLALLALGGALVIWGLKRGNSGRLTRRTRYRPPAWGRRDLVLAGASLLLAAALVAIKVAAPASLLFYPYPRLTWPPFNPWIGALLLMLALPVALLGRHERATGDA